MSSFSPCSPSSAPAPTVTLSGAERPSSGPAAHPVGACPTGSTRSTGITLPSATIHGAAGCLGTAIASTAGILSTRISPVRKGAGQRNGSMGCTSCKSPKSRYKTSTGSRESTSTFVSSSLASTVERLRSQPRAGPRRKRLRRSTMSVSVSTTSAPPPGSFCHCTSSRPSESSRLELRPDGKLELTLKSVWKDGTRAILLPPRDLIIRLIAAIPPPRFHLVRYFGVLSSHSKFRSEVVPKPPQDPAAFKPHPASGDQLEFPKLNAQTDDARPSRKRWARLLAHVFRADLDTCVRCGGPMRWLEAATTEQAATALLAKLGLAPQPPPTPPPGLFGQLRFGFC